ncbi:hypothetical protein CSKR_113277 [Clonorchis sinensis]|uniref:Uncharacterized protein n=1 Tax=Clonorchis sinensis TaxID=79923 RepID=A0A3R7C7J5_CLOSI|nr:hypothetical protein CSKR_113277 [Clonorchis sinensis]
MTSRLVNLTIKSPNDKIPCQNICCPSVWTVKELKAHLCECYPTNPTPASQRLIHAGKLLKDEACLESVFRDSTGVQTIHLVCRGPKTVQQLPTTSIPSNQDANADNLSDITPEDMAEYQRGYYEYLQQFYMNSSDRCSVTNPSSVSFVNFPFQNPWAPGPVGGYIGAQNPWQYPPAVLPPVSQTEVEIAPPNRDNLPAAAEGNQWFRGARAFLADLGVVNADGVDGAAPAGGNQGPLQQQQQAMVVGNPMAGGFMGAEEMGENAGNMDIVDRFYMLFRLCLFIGLCFAYSSLDKAIIVFSVAAYVYFYNIYRRHAAVRQAAAQAQQAVQPAPQREPQPTDRPQTEPVEGSGVGDTTDADQQVRLRPITSENQSAPAGNTEPLPADRQPPFVRLTGTLRLVANTSYQFVSSLLTSLIPEQPPPIRLD